MKALAQNLGDNNVKSSLQSWNQFANYYSIVSRKIET